MTSAAINRWRIVPAMQTDRQETDSLFGNVATEFALAVTVIGIATLLGVSAP